jgi:uncharacterized protein YbaP (TraB family)
VNALYTELGHEKGRTFFDALEARTRSRALRYVSELDISRETLQTLKPWLAYYMFVTAFDRKFGHSEGFTSSADAQLPPEFVLAGEAAKERRPIHFELTMEAWIWRLAGMSDHLQSQYLDWLFAWFDDELGGVNHDRFDWMDGRLVARPINGMRTRYPDLYEIMDAERNRWWATTIEELLARGGCYFAAIGQEHCADPQGIPAQLVRLGILKPSALTKV